MRCLHSNTFMFVDFWKIFTSEYDIFFLEVFHFAYSSLAIVEMNIAFERKFQLNWVPSWLKWKSKIGQFYFRITLEFWTLKLFENQCKIEAIEMANRNTICSNE